MKKIGILTSGGDCQGLNAAIRGVAKGLYEEIDDVEIYGIQNGYAGLIHGDYKKMNQSDFSGILTIGGTILGTSRQPFKMMRVIEDENSIDKVAAMKDNYKKMGLDCLVILGGNGTHKTANLLSEEGLNVVTMPKTIDNDVWGTEMTFGFQSAVDIATEVIDCIHTTATSHGRIFIVEVMGHKVGWLNLYAGIAGGADIILLPEIPYDINEIAKVIEKREQAGKRFSILAVAEGAISKEEAKMKKKELKALRASMPYPSISYKIAKELEEVTGHEIRVIGIRHGEKMYETLLTNEECANAVDMGKFYRVPCDKRDLNYDKYFKDGDKERNTLTEFNSSNTELLNVEQVKEKLLSLAYIREELEMWQKEQGK